MTNDHRTRGYQEAKERLWRRNRNEKEKGKRNRIVGQRYFHSNLGERRIPATVSSAEGPEKPRRARSAVPGPRLGAGPRGGGATEAERAPKRLAEEECAGLRFWAGSGPPALTPERSPPTPALISALAAVPGAETQALTRLAASVGSAA